MKKKSATKWGSISTQTTLSKRMEFFYVQNLLLKTAFISSWVNLFPISLLRFETRKQLGISSKKCRSRAVCEPETDRDREGKRMMRRRRRRWWRLALIVCKPNRTEFQSFCVFWVFSLGSIFVVPFSATKANTMVTSIRRFREQKHCQRILQVEYS